jgi:anti-anti-sigma factor
VAAASPMSESARTPTLEVRWPRTDVVQLVLRGEHDLASGDRLAEAVRAVLGVCTQLVVDLSGIEFIDTTLINGLCRAKRQADLRAVAFNVVIGGNELVARALEVTSLTGLLHGVDSLEAALQPRPSVVP